MLNGNNIKTLFSFFFKTGIRSRRAKLFFLVSLIPTVIFVIVRVVALVNPDRHFSLPGLYLQVGGVFYFQLFIQLLCLFYGSAVISDELDNKTLVYLTTSPVSRASILTGKFLAHWVISIIIIIGGIVISFVMANFSKLTQVEYLEKLGLLSGVAFLAISAYSALFTFLGILMKKSILVGLFFIFGWESVVQLFPGTTQKLTVNHYIKSLLPANLSGTRSILPFRLQSSPAPEAIVTLVFIALIFLCLAAFLFYKKEFLLADQG